MNKSARDITKDERVIVLSSLVAGDSRIVSSCRIELILPDVRSTCCQGKEEPLHSDDVHGVDFKCPRTDGGLARCYCIVSARNQRREAIVTGRISVGRA